MLFMDNTIAAAASGMKYRAASLAVTGNNIANLENPGYKKSKALAESFGDCVSYRMDDAQNKIGNTSRGAAVSEIAVCFDQGGLYPTGEAFDLALEGEGFFTLQNKDGEMFYTRNGSFSLDADGFLVGSQGFYVMGQNGAVSPNGGKAGFEVNSDGEVFSENEFVDILAVANLTDKTLLKNVAGGCFIYEGEEQSYFSGRVIQGYLEKPNVDIIDEMAAIIKDQRAFQSCAQMLKIADQALQKSVNEIAKV